MENSGKMLRSGVGQIDARQPVNPEISRSSSPAESAYRRPAQPSGDMLMAELKSLAYDRQSADDLADQSPANPLSWAALAGQPIFDIVEGIATGPIIADNAISGGGSRVGNETNSAMTAITSVLRANTSGLAPSKS